MALVLKRAERFHLAGNVAHDALVSVEERVAQILRRQEKELILLRKTKQRDERVAMRRRTAKAHSEVAQQERARSNRARAHRSAMGTTEGLPGAPRSGSA